MIIAGGRPTHVVERFMIKDDEGIVMSTREYVKGNPHLFRYLGHTRVNSVIYHTYLFIG